jgi:hypothetical protein
MRRGRIFSLIFSQILLVFAYSHLGNTPSFTYSEVSASIGVHIYNATGQLCGIHSIW